MDAPNRSSEVRVSRAELMGWLNEVPELRAHMQQSQERHRLVVGELLTELHRAGYAVESLDDLRVNKTAYDSAIPILLKWLPQISEKNAKESIVRALSVPWARPAASHLLIHEFREASIGSSLKWAIGNALAVVADDSVIDELFGLVRNREYGHAREMVVVALGNMRDPRAVDVLIELLNDEEVNGHAVMALGELRAQSGQSHVERFLNHPKAWIRKEAKKALVKIDKVS